MMINHTSPSTSALNKLLRAALPIMQGDQTIARRFWRNMVIFFNTLWDCTVLNKSYSDSLEKNTIERLTVELGTQFTQFQTAIDNIMITKQTDQPLSSSLTP